MNRPKLPDLVGNLDEVHLNGGADSARSSMTLSELWLLLVRRWEIVSISLIASIAIGTIYALSSPHVYAFTTIIEIGTRFSTEKSVDWVEPPEMVRTKIATGYAPQVLQEYYKKSASSDIRYGIGADIPKNSHLVVLSSVGPSDTEATYALLHSSIAARVHADHQLIVGALRKDLEDRLGTREKSLGQLKEQAAVFDAQLKRLENNRSVPVKEMAYFTSLRLSDNHRAQADLLVQIDRIRQQLVHLRDTRVVVPPTKSLDPVSFSKRYTILVAAAVGLFVGLIAALAMESFKSSARALARRKY